MKYYITKYCLTKGIMFLEGEISSDGYFSSNYPLIIGILGVHCHNFYCHTTLESAISHANILRNRKIKSLERKIKNLKELDFEVIEYE